MIRTRTYLGPDRRSPLKGVLRYLDWRTWAALAVVLMVVLVGYAVWTSANARDQAFDSLQTSRAAATRRIDLLTQQIRGLQQSADKNGALIAQLQAQIEALRQQLMAAGIEPVVPSPAPRPTPRRTASSSPAPRPTGRPTATPSRRPSPGPTPSPSRSCLLPPIVCP